MEQDDVRQINGELSRSEARLAELASFASEDGLLLELISNAKSGFRSPVSVLTNGMIITGVLTDSKGVAEHLDSQQISRFEALDTPNNIKDEDWEKFLDLHRHKLATLVDEARKEESELWSRLNSDEAESAAGEDEEASILFGRQPFLTIEKATIIAPGQQGVTRAEFLRIPTRAVSGWWVPDADVRADGSFSVKMSFWEPIEES